ncbi:MAG: RagB/SusD family nutrient uptake outer membrane protein [Alistipes sp.]|nr:RagB/SusD family nutrient uptake outer membrane protein [Alistipes senegalensis]MCM1250987.1 RagB/SusD family nutrient uptake outer membrane protein [Alistipes sp.]
MNATIKYLSAILLAGAVSCSLDTESMSSIDSGTYYKTMADAEAARVGCYDGYRRISAENALSFTLASEVMGDDCFGGAGMGDARNYQMLDRFDIAQAPGSVNEFNDLWRLSYNAIFNCNTLLANLGNIEWKADASRGCETPEATRDAYEGEARFLRAVVYFDLVRLFERVPLLTVPTKEVVAQAAPEETYALIIADLKFAMEHIPYVPTPAWHKSFDGTATADAAAALLGRVYLFYTGYYGKEHEALTKAEAVEALEFVVERGNYGLVQKGDDDANGFTRLWRAAIATDAGAGKGLDNHSWVGRACEYAETNEFIFTQKFNFLSNYNGNASGNRWLVMVGLRNIDHVQAVPYGKGWGIMTVSPDAKRVFEAADPRLKATIIDFASEGRTGVTDQVVSLGDWREFTGYNFKKYIPLSCNVDGKAVAEVSGSDFAEGEQDFQISQYQDVVIMRYADVLLMLSELKEDASYMNLVRQRAGMGDLAYSKENILAERHRELMGEGVRYWDLLRQGVEYAAETIAGSWTVQSGNVDDRIVISKENILSKRGLCRIPESQIVAANGVYTQNPGWN